MGIRFSQFAGSVSFETAFNVLAVARQLKATGKRVIELEIGDSPFPSTANAKQAGIQAINQNQSHYCASAGLPELRSAASTYVNREHALNTTAANIVIGPGATVNGELRFEREVNLYVSNRASVGSVTGATAIPFSGDLPPN